MLKSLYVLPLFFSSLAFALPTDPDCLNVPTDEPVQGWKIEGLDNLLGSNPAKIVEIPVTRTSLFAAGTRFSEVVYLLPDLELSESPANFVSEFKNFFSRIPKSHELYHVMSDPQNGLKYAILKPKAVSEFKPWIVSIAGTQTFLDKIADGLMGRAQMDRLVNLFTKCLFQNAEGRSLANIPLIFVGHSLGGGLAQGLYHQIQSRWQPMRAAGYASPLHMVTINAFGGQQLLEQINVSYNRAYVEDEKVANYYIRGDVISRVGTHIGPTFEMVPVDAQGAELKLSLGSAHALKTVYDIVAKSASLRLPMPTVSKAPPKLYTINKFYESQKDKKLGFALFLYPKISYLVRSNNGSITEFILGSLNEVVRQGEKNPAVYALVKYLKILAADEELRLRKRFSLTGKADVRAEQFRVSMEDSLRRFDNIPGALMKWHMEQNKKPNGGP